MSFRLDAVDHANLTDRGQALRLSPTAAAKQLVLDALSAEPSATPAPEAQAEPSAKEEQVEELRGQVLELRKTLGRVFEALLMNLSDIPKEELRPFIKEVLKG